MKKLLLIVFMFGTVLVFGQTKGFSVGLEAGPSLRLVKGNKIINSISDPALGFSGGMMLQYRFTRLVAIRTGVSFERKGYKVDGTRTDTNGVPIEGGVTIYSNFDYIVLPLLVNFSFGERVRLFVNIGAYTGYLVKQSEVIKPDGIFPATDNTPFFKEFDYGLVSGVGSEIPLKENLSLTLEIRNNLGLTPINDYEIYNDEDLKLNSTAFLFGVVYRFGVQ